MHSEDNVRLKSRIARLETHRDLHQHRFGLLFLDVPDCETPLLLVDGKVRSCTGELPGEVTTVKVYRGIDPRWI